ncbi:MAG: DUF86 domain-containing protein [Candidatus Nanohaloarchaea archaeon]
MSKVQRVEEKIRTVRRHLDKVERNLPETEEEFSSMGIEKDGIYKNVESAIQASYDICALIVKEEDFRVPGDEESLPDILVEENILDEKTGDKLKDMKGFRNALAHRYGEIDDGIAFDNISQGLNDFESFLEQVEKYLSSR